MPVAQKKPQITFEQTSYIFGEIDEGDKNFEKQKQRLLDLYERELGNEATLFSGFDDLLQSLEENYRLSVLTLF